MSKKIQVSTVKQTADVQVIDLNAYIIAKAIRASLTLHNAFDPSIYEHREQKLDDNGDVVLNENGEPVVEMVRTLSTSMASSSEMLNAYDTAIKFIDELVAAFEGEEQSPSFLD